MHEKLALLKMVVEASQLLTMSSQASGGVCL